jgi:hypothetical protein
MAPVHIQNIGQYAGIGSNIRDPVLIEGGLESVLVDLGQAAEKDVMILLDNGRFKRGCRTTAGGKGVLNAMQDVELKDLLKVVHGPVKGHKAESGEILVLVQVGFKGGQELLGGDEGIVFELAVGAEQAELDMHVVQKSAEIFKCADGQGVPQGGGILPGDVRDPSKCLFPGVIHTKAEARGDANVWYIFCL